MYPRKQGAAAPCLYAKIPCLRTKPIARIKQFKNKTKPAFAGFVLFLNLNEVI
jgi:hypothetical protein